MTSVNSFDPGSISVYSIGYVVACGECGEPLRHSPFAELAEAFEQAISHARDYHEQAGACGTAWSESLVCDGCGRRLSKEDTIPDPEHGYWLGVHEAGA